MDLRRFVIGLLVGLACTGIGGFLIYDHYQTTMNSTPVDGVVVESSVVEYEGDGTTGDPGGARPAIEYRYTYQGTTYTSSTLCPGEGNGCYGPDTEKVAQSVVDRYPEGSTVTVHVDPDDPSSAYLIEGDSGTVGSIAVEGIPLVYFVPVGFGLLALGATAVRFVKLVFGVRKLGHIGGSAASGRAAQSDGTAHPIVGVVVGAVIFAVGAYTVHVGAVLFGLIFAASGLGAFLIGVRQFIWG